MCHAHRGECGHVADAEEALLVAVAHRQHGLHRLAARALGQQRDLHPRGECEALRARVDVGRLGVEGRHGDGGRDEQVPLLHELAHVRAERAAPHVQALHFERARTRGFRLDIPAGTAVRFEPGQSRTVRLVAYGGKRVVYGFRGEVMGPLDEGAQP